MREGDNGQWVDCNLTLLKITRQPFWKRHSCQSLGFCLQPQRTCTWNLKLPKPCHPETEKSNMAARQPFTKWGHWKSIGSYPCTKVFCHWRLELIFKAKQKLVRNPKKNKMAARRPFWKWRRWKSIGFFPYIYIYISIVPLKFGVDIQSQTIVRVRKQKNPTWLPGGHFEIDIAANQ